MDSTQMRVEGDETGAPRVCGWCGKVLRDFPDTAALASQGICRRCASVLEGQSIDGHEDAQAASGNDLNEFLEQRLNELMCRLYESRQMLLEVQKRVRADRDLRSRVGHALAAVRRQERLLVDIQRRIESSP